MLREGLWRQIEVSWSIKHKLGFSNLIHLNRVFKAVTGMTPSGYRKSHKNLEIYVGGIRKRKGGQDNR